MAELNLTPISELITGFTGFMPDLVTLIVAMIPVVVVCALAKFFPEIFNRILGMLKFK